MREKTLVSFITMFSSLFFYFYSRSKGYDTVAFTMVGGFIGAMLSELALSFFRRKK